MKRLASAMLIPLALALALPAAAAPRSRKSARKRVPHKPAVVRTYRNTRIPGMALAPTSVLRCSNSLTADEQAFVDRVNQERAERALRLLVVDPILVAGARQHSREMADLNYFDHYSPVKGMRTPLERYGVALGNKNFTCTVGENLFYCSSRDVDLGHRSLMKSPGHRANILASDYVAIGVGIHEAADGQYYVTQMYHTR